MIFFDIIFLGFYLIFNKIYGLKANENNGFGPIEHSFYISVAIHTMNIDTFWSYISVNYFHKDVSIYLSILILIIFSLLGYLFYYKQQRAETLINRRHTNGIRILYIFISLSYVVISAHLMITVGNFNREILTGQSFETNKIKLEGIYTATPNINTFDTLTLNNRGEYIHVIYRKNNSFVYRNSGKWKVSGDRLIVTDFLLNKDQIYNKNINDFDNELFSFSFAYKIISDKIIISFGEEKNDYYYQSIR